MRWLDGITDSMDISLNSGSWWWTRRPGMLPYMGSQSRTWLSDWTELMQYSSSQHWTLLSPPDTSTAEYHFQFWPSCFIPSGAISNCHSSPVAYWTLFDPVGSSFGVISFAFSYCSWDSWGTNAEVTCYSLLHWTTFSQNSPLWSAYLRWPCMAWLIASRSYANPFATSRLSWQVIHISMLCVFLKKVFSTIVL